MKTSPAIFGRLFSQPLRFVIQPYGPTPYLEPSSVCVGIGRPCSGDGFRGEALCRAVKMTGRVPALDNICFWVVETGTVMEPHEPLRDSRLRGTKADSAPVTNSCSRKEGEQASVWRADALGIDDAL